MRSNVVAFVKKEVTLPQRSDDDLMLLSVAGAEAFEELVRRHAPRLLGFCRKNTGDRPFAEELAQEVWLSVWAHRRDYRAEGKFVVWLFTLARNRLRNASRGEARGPAAAHGEQASEGLAALHPSDLDRMIAVERQARVHKTLARLPEGLREAVALRFGAELPYDEVARVLGTNESTPDRECFMDSASFEGVCEVSHEMSG